MPKKKEGVANIIFVLSVAPGVTPGVCRGGELCSSSLHCSATVFPTSATIDEGYPTAGGSDLSSAVSCSSRGRLVPKKGAPYGPMTRRSNQPRWRRLASALRTRPSLYLLRWCLRRAQALCVFNDFFLVRLVFVVVAVFKFSTVLRRVACHLLESAKNQE